MRVRGCRVRRSAQAQHATVLCGSAVGQGFDRLTRPRCSPRDCSGKRSREQALTSAGQPCRRSRSRKCEQLPASLTAKLLRAAVARHHRRVVDATRRALPCRGRVNDMTVGATIRGICLATSGPGILRPQHLCVALGTRHRSHEGVFHGLSSGWRRFLRGRNGAQRQHTVVMRTRGAGSLKGHYGPSGPPRFTPAAATSLGATQCHKRPRWSDTVPGERRRPTGGTPAISAHPASEGRTRAASGLRQRRFPPALCCAGR